MPPPNLLFLFTDEQRYDTLAAYGNELIEMPNLNRLAEESWVFERAYVTQPVCTPSRSTLMTGLYPHTTGCTENNVSLRPETPCMPEMLPAGQYVTGYHGKWHLGDEIFAQHGFDDWRGIDDGYRGYYSKGRDRDARSSYHHWLVAHGRQPENGSHFGRHEVAALPEELSKPAYLAEEASRFITDNSDRPFCLFVNFFEPHMPFTGPRDGQYDPDDVPLPRSFENPPGIDQPLKSRLLAHAYATRGFEGCDLSSERGWRALIARYWGLCSQVDTHVGRVLDALDEAGLADNTIVVYTSDHGDMMGDHQLLAKCVMYEPAVRVPLLIRLPGRRSSDRWTQPVSQVDLVPTLLELMGADLPAHLEGQSLANGLTGGYPPPPRDVFIEWNGVNNGFGDHLGKVTVIDEMRELAEAEEVRSAMCDPVRTVVTPDGWKLNLSSRGEHELYHLTDDPDETINLARSEAHRHRLAELAGRIHTWQDRTGDTAPRTAVDGT